MRVRLIQMSHVTAHLLQTVFQHHDQERFEVFCYALNPDDRSGCVHVCCSVLQCVAVCCSVLQCLVVFCSVLQCVAVCYSVLQCVAVSCSVV